jgi:hypothetical protein
MHTTIQLGEEIHEKRKRDIRTLETSLTTIVLRGRKIHDDRTTLRIQVHDEDEEEDLSIRFHLKYRLAEKKKVNTQCLN